MNRREFVASTAAAIVGGSAVGVSATPVPSSVKVNLAADVSARPFPFSVMLWTVEPKLPFEQRIAKVSEAGYHAVELVEEYKAWGKDDFAAARKQFQHLGIVVDACSGIHASLCDPAQRDALTRELHSRGSIQDREIVLLRKDGALLHCLSSGFVIRDSFGRIVRLQGTLVDITERREMEKRLHQE